MLLFVIAVLRKPKAFTFNKVAVGCKQPTAFLFTHSN